MRAGLDTLVLHDYFESLEGGGRLSSLLARELPAALGYGFAKAEHPFLRDQAQTHDLKRYSALPLWRQWQLARAFAQRADFVGDYQNIIYSGFYTPLAIAHSRGRNILYCHTPPRFIYDQRGFYRARLPAPLRPALDAFGAYLKPRYEAAAAQMDVILTNSRNVQQRIQHFLGLRAEVVYPPCDTARFRWLGQGDYYLSLARLDPLKRVDKIIEAFLAMPDQTLLVASGGPELQRLQKQARGAANIRFIGWLDDARLADVLGNAIATLYLPKDEDFGMTPVESMASGKPVIGVAEGGLLESIIDGETGRLLPPDFSAATIQAAVRNLDKKRAYQARVACETRAACFDKKNFLQKIRSYL